MTSIKKIEQKQHSHTQSSERKMEDLKDVFEIGFITLTNINAVSQETKFSFYDTLTKKEAIITRRSLAIRLSKLLYPDEAAEEAGRRFIKMPEKAEYWKKTVSVQFKPYWNRYMGIYQLIDYLAFKKAYEYHEFRGGNEFLDRTAGKLMPYSDKNYLFIQRVKLFNELRKENEELKFDDVKIDTFNDLPIIKQYINRHNEKQPVPKKETTLSTRDEIAKLKNVIDALVKRIEVLESS